MAQNESNHDIRKNRVNTCYRCGKAGHFSRDPGCPATGQSCHMYGLEGHFHTWCRAKRKADGKRGTRGHSNPVRAQLAEEEEELKYAFACWATRKDGSYGWRDASSTWWQILVPAQISWTSKHGNEKQSEMRISSCWQKAMHVCITNTFGCDWLEHFTVKLLLGALVLVLSSVWSIVTENLF